MLTAGLALSAIGTGLYTAITPHGSYLAHILPGMAVLGFGSGLTLPTLGVAAVHRVTARDAGLASGIQQAVQQIGGAIGLAVLATIALRHIDNVHSANSTTDGYALALRVGAGLLVAGAIASLTLLPARAAEHETVPGADADALA